MAWVGEQIDCGKKIVFFERFISVDDPAFIHKCNETRACLYSSNAVAFHGYLPHDLFVFAIGCERLHGSLREQWNMLVLCNRPEFYKNQAGEVVGKYPFPLATFPDDLVLLNV